MSQAQNAASEQERAKVLQRVKEYGYEVREKASEVVDVACDWTREHPLTAIGISVGFGAAVGFLVGLLVARK